VRHPVDALIILVLLALLAAFLQARTMSETAAARPSANSDAVHHQAPALDRPLTKFDLLFSEPELAR